MLSAGKRCFTATHGAHAQQQPQHWSTARLSNAAAVPGLLLPPPAAPPPPQCQHNSTHLTTSTGEGDGAQPGRSAARSRRKARTAADNEQLVQVLVERTALSRAAAQHFVAAAQRQAGFPRDAAKLCSRVAALQQLLGPEHAATALRAFPRLASYSSETLAHNYQQWQAFFAPDHDGDDDDDHARADAAAFDDAGGQGKKRADDAMGAARHHEQVLLERLAHSPQLLTVNVELQVGNLYEAGVMLGAQDLHEFAFRTMNLARTQPATLSEKLRTTLDFLNSSLQQYHQQQAEQPALHDASSSSSSSQEEAEQLESVTMAQLHMAATRDHSWLGLASATLQQRLLGVAHELQLPWPVVVSLFLRQPSIFNKRPALLGQRAAALQQLPGVGPARAAAIIAALPTILQLQPATVQHRWQQLQQAAASHPAWAQAMAALSPSNTAGLLIRSQVRYDRLQEVAARGWQAAYSPVTVLNATPARYAKMLLKQQQQQLEQPPAAAAAANKEKAGR